MTSLGSCSSIIRINNNNDGVGGTHSPYVLYKSATDQLTQTYVPSSGLYGSITSASFSKNNLLQVNYWFTSSTVNSRMRDLVDPQSGQLLKSEIISSN